MYFFTQCKDKKQAFSISSTQMIIVNMNFTALCTINLRMHPYSLYHNIHIQNFHTSIHQNHRHTVHIKNTHSHTRIYIQAHRLPCWEMEGTGEIQHQIATHPFYFNSLFWMTFQLVLQTEITHRPQVFSFPLIIKGQKDLEE